MGAVSIVEDIVKRWDEVGPGNILPGPAGSVKNGLPLDLLEAFDALIDRLERVSQRLKCQNLNDSWHALASKIDVLDERVRRFNYSLPLARCRQDIYDHSNQLQREVNLAMQQWTGFIKELSGPVDPIRTQALKVQLMNPEDYDERLTMVQRQSCARADLLLRGFRLLRKAHSERLAAMDEMLHIVEAERVLGHSGGLPMLDKDACQKDEEGWTKSKLVT